MKTDKAEFEIIGCVANKFVAGSGKFAKLSMETSVGGRRVKHNIKFFDSNLIQQIDMIGIGEFITVSGKIGIEILKDKAGNEIEVDGYHVWMPSIIGEKINNGGAIRKTPVEMAAESGPPDDDDIPF